MAPNLCGFAQLAADALKKSRVSGARPNTLRRAGEVVERFREQGSEVHPGTGDAVSACRRLPLLPLRPPKEAAAQIGPALLQHGLLKRESETLTNLWKSCGPDYKMVFAATPSAPASLL